MVFSIRQIGSSGAGSSPPERVPEDANVPTSARSGFSQDSAQANDVISGVWGNKGHVFVAKSQGRSLFVTDSLPRPRWAKYYTAIQEDQSFIVSVLSNPASPSQVYVIHRNSMAECLEYDSSTNHWVKKQQFQLSNAKGAEILSISLHPETNMFFWCENRSSTPGIASCCVCMREVTEQWSEDITAYIGPVVAILHSCPVMGLYMMRKGVCMVPHLPDDEGRLLLFWTFVPRTLKAYVWSYGTISDLDKSDFKSIMMDILPVWNTASQDEPGNLVSQTSQLTTLELLLVSKNLLLSYAVILNGLPVIKSLCSLSILDDFGDRYICQSFAFSLFIGLVWDSGVITLYDVKSGAPLHSITELSGIKFSTWVSTGVVPRAGFWSSNGIWQLESKSIADIAAVIQTSVKTDSRTKEVSSRNPLPEENISTEKYGSNELNLSNSSIDTVKAEEKSCSVLSGHCSCNTVGSGLCFREYLEECIPNCCCCCLDRRGLLTLESQSFVHHIDDMKDESANHQVKPFAGPVAAVKFLQVWGFDPLAAKVALNAAVSSELLATSTKPDTFIAKELLDLLFSESFQSPALALALLWNNPAHRTVVVKELRDFLNKLETGADAENAIIKTALNKALLPYMQKFQVHAEKFQALLQEQEFLSLSNDICTKSVGEQTEHILKTVDLSSPCNAALAQLGLLESHSHQEVLESVAHFTGLICQKETLQEKVYNQRWRKIYRLEWKDGRWQKSRMAQEEQHNSFLSLLCHLMYTAEPDWLLNMKGKGVAIVNTPDTHEQAEDYIVQSVLDCLPVLKVDPTPKSTHVHSLLLWAAGQEMQAMQVILRHQMWLQAVEFFSMCPKDTESSILLYTMLLKAILIGRVPSMVLFKALNLVPEGLSTYEVLAILRETGKKCVEPFMFGARIPTVGDMRVHLEKFLSS